jgi:SAM-dependent methyltransferase
MSAVCQETDAGRVSFRPDIERLRRVNHETRSSERLYAHYLIERDLASRLRTSTANERSRLYGDLYTQLFARLPDHPQHRIDPSKRRRNTETQVDFLRSHLRPKDVMVEMGCGDAAVTQAIAAFVREAIGVDVTSSLIKLDSAPMTFRFLKTSGTELDLPDSYADLIYSNQLMEHLHPDDASVQLKEIHRVLKPGGRYICVTPSRLTGPHDISTYFTYEPSGFHLREYDHATLAAKFREAGFRQAKAHVTVKGRPFLLPVALMIAAEKLVQALPMPLRLRFTQIGPVRNFAGVTLIGRK